jgi:hypothetical protein
VLNEVGDYIRKLLFVDKALFHINDHVNQYHCQIWGAELLHEAFEFTQDTLKGNMLCGLLYDFVTRPFFFCRKHH